MIVSCDLLYSPESVDKSSLSVSAFCEMNKYKSNGVYINPFRVVNFSYIPSHILQELTSYSFLTQIAILINPEIRQKYFPNWRQ